MRDQKAKAMQRVHSAWLFYDPVKVGSLAYKMSERVRQGRKALSNY